MKVRYRKSVPLIPVEHPVVGKYYHVAWGYSRGIVGVCMSIDEESRTVIMRTPKTKRLFKNPVKFSDLRHTRTQQYKISQQTKP